MLYNELIVDGFVFNQNLPRSIEAFVMIAGKDILSSARAHHEAFLQEYHLSASDIPMIVYHPDRDAEGNVFTLASEEDYGRKHSRW